MLEYEQKLPQIQNYGKRMTMLFILQRKIEEKKNITRYDIGEKRKAELDARVKLVRHQMNIYGKNKLERVLSLLKRRKLQKNIEELQAKKEEELSRMTHEDFEKRMDELSKEGRELWR